MKKSLLFLMLFTVPAAGFSQDLAKDTTAIKNTITDFFEMFVKDDLHYLDSNCTSEFELYESGQIWNNDTLRTIIRKRQARQRTWERTNAFTFLKFNVQQDVAWVSYFNTAYLTHTSTQEKRTVRWLESAVLVRKNKKWQLAQMHSTSLTK
ncbi:MAG: DUF4440 domain-containing protein [Spirosomataceae bacterium]